MAYRLSNAERETIIRRSVEDKEWDIYTADPALMRKLDKLFEPTETREEAHWYKLPLNAISIRKPTKKEMTEEQRKQALSRLKVARAKKDAQKHRQNQSLLEAMGAGR